MARAASSTPTRAGFISKRSSSTIKRLLAAGLSLLLAASLPAQGKLAGKRVGLYLSSRAFTYTPPFSIPLAQYAGISDSNEASLKTQALLRLGGQMAAGIQAQAQADTVIYLNTDPLMGRAFINQFDGEQRRLFATEGLEQLDYVIALHPVELSTRLSTVVYARSNRLVTERVHVRLAKLSWGLYDLRAPGNTGYFQLCFDEGSSTLPPLMFDFDSKRSSFGLFFSRLWTLAWQKQLEGVAEFCE